MEYLEIKERLSETNELAEVLDSWQEGVPFIYQEEDRVYDAFLFYSGNNQKSTFYRAEMLILLNCRTGTVKSFSVGEIAKNFQTAENFQYTPKGYKDIDEYFALKQQVEDTYLALRTETLENGGMGDAQAQYVQAVRNFVSQEIIEKVYKKLNGELFR